MNATITWVDGAMFVGASGSGHAVIMDGPADHGGRNLGVRPMEMLLLGLGGCTAFDVVDILKKARQPVRDCRVEIAAARADAVPSVFTRIHIHFVIAGAGLSEKHVARAVDLSATKYCSASAMLEKGGVSITHDYAIEATT